MLAGRGESVPQGLKPPILLCRKRPKAEALGYLEAEANTEILSFAQNDGGWLAGWRVKQATAKTNTGVLRCAQDDDVKQATAKANTEILSFAQNDDGWLAG
jgi:hypothetical protein